MKIIKAPDALEIQGSGVFLAGSIEMGKAEHWQRQVESALTGCEAAGLVGCAVTLLNPRRDDWDDAWVQRIENAQFRQQVEWELTAQELADVIVLYFVPGTRSPISLLELGLFAASGKMIVCCPPGFWRKGNVDIVCQRYGVRQVKSLDALIAAIKDAAIN